MAVQVKLTFSTDEYEVEEFDLPIGTQLRAVGNMVVGPDSKTISTVAVKKPRRKLEIEMLKALASHAYRKKDAKMEEIHTCVDLFGQFKNLADDKSEIVLVESDIKYLVQALEALGEQRPIEWCRHCMDMIAQLSSPEKVKQGQ